MRLAIIIGHTEFAGGIVAKEPIGVSEYVFNTEIANLMKEHADELGIECQIFKRDGIGIAGVGARVNAWTRGHTSAAIELHLNASVDGAARGTETLYDSEPAENEAFAKRVQAAVCQVLERTWNRDRGAKLLLNEHNGKPADRGFTNLKAVAAMSCLVEPVFGDNRADANLLHLRKREYAHCLVDAAYYFHKGH